MMERMSLHLLLLAVAFVLFILVAANVPSRVNLLGLGLAFVALALIFG